MELKERDINIKKINKTEVNNEMTELTEWSEGKKGMEWMRGIEWNDWITGLNGAKRNEGKEERKWNCMLSLSILFTDWNFLYSFQA